MKIIKVENKSLTIEDISSDLINYLQKHIETEQYSFMNDYHLINDLYIIYDDGCPKHKFKNNISYLIKGISFDGDIYIVKRDNNYNYCGLEDKDIGLVKDMING